MTAATRRQPFPQRSIQDEDESVRIAIRALGDMRNSAPLHSPHSHPPSIACAYLSPTLHVLGTYSSLPPLQPPSPPPRFPWHLRQTLQPSPPRRLRRRILRSTPRRRTLLPACRPSPSSALQSKRTSRARPALASSRYVAAFSPATTLKHVDFHMLSSSARR